MTSTGCMDAIKELVALGYSIVIHSSDSGGLMFKIEKDGNLIAMKADEKKLGMLYVGRACTVVEEVLRDVKKRTS